MNSLRQREQQVLAEGREWTRQRLKEQLQLDSIAMEMTCPESGEELEEVRWRDLQLETVAGTVRLKVRHGYSPELERWICPARLAWGLAAYARMSPELEARVAYTATEVGSMNELRRWPKLGVALSAMAAFMSMCASSESKAKR